MSPLVKMGNVRALMVHVEKRFSFLLTLKGKVTLPSSLSFNQRCKMAGSAFNFTIPQTASVLILADSNFGDPKPHTLAEFLKFDPSEVSLVHDRVLPVLFLYTLF